MGHTSENHSFTHSSLAESASSPVQFGHRLTTYTVPTSLTSHPDAGAGEVAEEPATSGTPATPCHGFLGDSPVLKIRKSESSSARRPQATPSWPQFFHQWNGDQSHACRPPPKAVEKFEGFHPEAHPATEEHIHPLEIRSHL